MDVRQMKTRQTHLSTRSPPTPPGRTCRGGETHCGGKTRLHSMPRACVGCNAVYFWPSRYQRLHHHHRWRDKGFTQVYPLVFACCPSISVHSRKFLVPPSCSSSALTSLSFTGLPSRQINYLHVVGSAHTMTCQRSFLFNGT